MARRRFKTYRMIHEEARARHSAATPRRQRTTRGDSFEPVFIDAGAAQRGVNARLLAAMFAATLACASAALAILGLLDRFSLLAAASIGLASGVASISLILSARREEAVHRLAHSLHAEHLLEHQPDPCDVDGSV